MKFVVSNRKLKPLIKGLSNLFDDMRIDVNRGGLKFKAMDLTHVVLVEGEIKASWFESFSGKGGPIGLDIKELNNRLSNLPLSCTVGLLSKKPPKGIDMDEILNRASQGVFSPIDYKLFFRENKNNIVIAGEHSFRCEHISYKDICVPSLKTVLYLKYIFNSKDICCGKDTTVVSRLKPATGVVFRGNLIGLYLYGINISRNHIGKLYIPCIARKMIVNDQTTRKGSEIDMDYLLNILKFTTQFETVEFSIGDNVPIKISFKGKGIKLNFLIAPRI
jgi:hypothetical protein